jgi:hypothetical protein
VWHEDIKWQEKGHWNPTIVELTQDILRLFHEMDQGLMTNVSINTQPTLLTLNFTHQTLRNENEHIAPSS